SVLRYSFFLDFVFLSACISFLSFQSSLPLRDLHSFPTRRSSDLMWSRPSTPPRSMNAPKSVMFFTTPLRTWSFSSSFMSFSRLRSEVHTSELQSRGHLVCRLLLEKKKK